MKRYLSNKELINDIANTHPMAEAFILSAIEKYSTSVIKSTPWSEHNLISFEMWKEIALDAFSRIENRSAG